MNIYLVMSELCPYIWAINEQQTPTAMNTKPTAYAISYTQPERNGPVRWHVYEVRTSQKVHAATSETKQAAINEAKRIARDLGGRLEATGYQTL